MKDILSRIISQVDMTKERITELEIEYIFMCIIKSFGEKKEFWATAEITGF